MYGEPFDIPAPDELVLVSWFQGGEVFRSGCCCEPRPRPDLLLPARPRDPPDVLPARRPARDRERGPLGGRAARRADHGREPGASRAARPVAGRSPPPVRSAAPLSRARPPRRRGRSRRRSGSSLAARPDGRAARGSACRGDRSGTGTARTAASPRTRPAPIRNRRPTSSFNRIPRVVTFRRLSPGSRTMPVAASSASISSASIRVT